MHIILILSVAKKNDAEAAACTVASFPGPRGEGERAWFQLFAHALNYLGFNQVLISGRVPMTPSKSHC